MQPGHIEALASKPCTKQTFQLGLKFVIRPFAEVQVAFTGVNGRGLA